MVGLVTPYIPFIGGVTGGLTVGKWHLKGRMEEEQEEPNTSNPPKGHTDPREEANDQE